MADDDDFCVAHFVPINTKARSLFHEAICEIAKEGCIDQLRFYEDEKALLFTSSSSSLDEPFDAETAFARLSIAEEKLPVFPRLGWRIGKRASDVDICIAPSNSNDLMRANQFVLFMHPRSGLLILRAGHQPDFTPSYKSTSSKFIRLEPSEELVLLQQSTQIQIAGCRFQVEYTVPANRSNIFFSHLSKFISEYHENELHRAGRLNPGTGYPASYERYVVGDKLGAGTYGDVRYGIEKKTGAPVALKDIRSPNSPSRDETLNEIAILDRFKNSPYILQLRDCWCEHGIHPKTCPGKKFEHILLVTDLAIDDFYEYALESLTYEVIIDLFRQVLLGIKTLHDQGVMHRDITLKNMLIMSFKPPRAVLGDFGKAIISQESKQTTIGPVPSCAPEVWSRSPYSSAIDIWSWAYAIASHLGYKPARKEQNSCITPQRLGSIHMFLEGKARSQPKLAELIDLISHILVWDPSNRYDMQQILAHDAWAILDEQEPPELPNPKRKKAESPSKEPESTAPKGSEETIPTMPLSKE